MNNLVSILEFALISEDIYKPDLPKGKISNQYLFHKYWSRSSMHYLPQFDSNFFARLYIRESENKKATAAVIAFRGTMPFRHPENDLSDLEMAVLHKLPLSYESALIFFHKARNYVRQNYPGIRIKLTGHSLGGALAQLIAIKTHHIAVVFNSPGIGELPDIDDKENYSNLIHNINSENGMINKVGKTIGDIHFINITKDKDYMQKAAIEFTEPMEKLSAIEEMGAGILAQHEIANVITALQNNPLSTQMY